MGTCRRPFVGPLVALLAAVALALPATAAAPGPAGAAPLQTSVGDCTPGAGWGSVRADYAAQVLALVNAHRTSMGLSSLKESPTLGASAVWKALHMAAYGYMSHDDPAPPIARTAGERIAACGYASGWWGENIAYGYSTPDSVMQAWLNSSGHRANIENPSYRVIGVGAAVSSGGTMTWAQDFGAYDDSGTGSPPPPPSPNPTPAPPKPSGSSGGSGSSPAPATSPQPSAPKAPVAPSAARTNAHKGTRGELSTLELIRNLPHVGHRFAAALIVHSPDGRRVLAGNVGCRGRIGHRHVRVVVNAFKHGTAVCAWRIPRRVHRRLLRGLIYVKSHGAQTSHLFGRRVR